MKKSKFIKQVLKSKDNTVFVNEEQVDNAIEVFEKLGMVPPDNGSGWRVSCEDNGEMLYAIHEGDKE